MCANWADNKEKSKNLIQVLLAPVKNQFGFDKKGGVAGYNFGDYDEYVSAIESYIKFNSEIPEPEKFNLLSNAVWAAAKTKSLDAENLLIHIKDGESKYLSQSKEGYEFISSISVKYFKGLNRSRLKPPIKFAQKIPRKFDFKSILKQFSYIDIKEIPDSYTFFRIPVKARNPNEAYRLGVDAIDLLRAIWNWYFKPQEYFFTSDHSQRPMNSITIGPFHTILKPDGKLFENFWYETEFQESVVDIRTHWDKLNSFERKSRRVFSKHLYRDEIENALIRFTQALDHSDKHTAFLQLWQVLERITGINNANYDQLIKRVAFLYEEVELEKGVLNHLRLHRNSSVHDGIKKDRIQKYLYQLRRYVENVLSFHIKNPFKASSLSEAVSFLDLPTDSGSLKKIFTQYKKAMKYRRIEI